MVGRYNEIMDRTECDETGLIRMRIYKYCVPVIALGCRREQTSGLMLSQEGKIPPKDPRERLRDELRVFLGTWEDSTKNLLRRIHQVGGERLRRTFGTTGTG